MPTRLSRRAPSTGSPFLSCFRVDGWRRAANVNGIFTVVYNNNSFRQWSLNINLGLDFRIGQGLHTKWSFRMHCCWIGNYGSHQQHWISVTLNIGIEMGKLWGDSSQNLLNDEKALTFETSESASCTSPGCLNLRAIILRNWGCCEKIRFEKKKVKRRK